MLKLLAPSVLRQALVMQAQSIGLLAPACNAVMGAASTSGNALTSSAVCSGHPYQQHSNYGTEAAPSASSSGDKQPSSSDTSSIGNDKVQKLADEVLGLTVLEASWLSDILRKKLNIAKPAFGAMPAMPFMAAAAAPAAASVGGDAKAPAAEEKKEKTEFDIKLESFSAEGKIKVIKEIRALTNLGLKEAKELVEKAPVVVKSAVPKADAENLKKQLEAAGGKVTLA